MTRPAARVPARQAEGAVSAPHETRRTLLGAGFRRGALPAPGAKANAGERADSTLQNVRRGRSHMKKQVSMCGRGGERSGRPRELAPATCWRTRAVTPAPRRRRHVKTELRPAWPCPCGPATTSWPWRRWGWGRRWWSSARGAAEGRAAAVPWRQVTRNHERAGGASAGEGWWRAPGAEARPSPLLRASCRGRPGVALGVSTRRACVCSAPGDHVADEVVRGVMLSATEGRARPPHRRVSRGRVLVEAHPTCQACFRTELPTRSGAGPLP
jgi:hypothetical protein